MEKRQEEYHKKKLEHMKNKKHERYILQCIGEGFIFFDMYNEREHRDKRGYMLIPDFNDNGYRVDKNYLSPVDLVDKLNELDFQVNGDLEGKNLSVQNKEAFLAMVRHHLNEILDKDLSEVQEFSVTFMDMNSFIPGDYKEIQCDFKVYDAAIPGILRDAEFNTVILVINRYLDELNTDDRDDSIKYDTLVELKMRLMEYMSMKERLDYERKSVQ